MVTATRRLARYASEADARLRVARGEGAWQTPDVLAWPVWLARCWRDHDRLRLGSGDRILLAEPQALQLWEQVIDADLGRYDPQRQGVWQVAATVRAAADAHRQRIAWRLAIWPEAVPERQAFERWQAAFRTRCEAHGWQDPAMLEVWLCEAVAGHAVALPVALMVTGFDRITPMQQCVLQSLATAGVEVAPWSAVQVGQRQVRVVRSVDPDAELAAAAHWARDHLQRDEVCGDTPRIGVVVPDLEAVRTRVERRFGEVLCPQATVAGQRAPARALHLSVGQRLAEIPLVATALRVLGLAAGRCEMAQIGAVARSPYLAMAASESVARAAFDRDLRAAGELQVPLDRLVELASSRPDCVRFYRGLDAMRAIMATVGGDELHPHGQWANLFSECLGALGWPGDGGLDSDEYQAHDAWYGLLADFADLALVGTPLPVGRAYEVLARMAGERMFQPRAASAPVEIMGMLEAAGQTFDALWITGLHDEAWPGAPRPDPFLPLAAQRQAGMPHADAILEETYARDVLGRLLAAAPVVVISYPQRLDDRAMRPSPLLAGSVVGADQPTGAALDARLQAAAPPPDRCRDETGIPCSDDPAAVGGSRILADQSACAFRAYAIHRLGARPLGQPEPGVGAQARGTLVHRILQGVWQQLKSHATLCACDEAALNALLEQIVDRELERERQRYPDSWGRAFARLERTRLVELVANWLALERRRPAFEVVHNEQQQYLSAGGLRFNLRIDRVDRLADGSLLVIDYKTGQVALRDWAGERPANPQLPLYALALGDGVAGVAFGQVRRGTIALLGVSNGVAAGGGVKALADCRALRDEAPDWPALVSHWRHVIDTLASAFARGEAAVDPRPVGDPCRYCEIRPLCRISSVTDFDMDETDAAA